MAAKLADGNGALALLCNTLPTGAILTVLILTFGPVSGAHFNPAVSIAFALRRELPWLEAAAYIAVQIVGGIVGVWAAHAMFELPLWQVSLTVRTGPGQWFAEFVAAFGLMLTILGCLALDACGHPLCGRPLHHGGFLVSRLDLVRQSGGDDRAGVVQLLRGHRAGRRCSFRRRAAPWRITRCGFGAVVVCRLRCHITVDKSHHFGYCTKSSDAFAPRKRLCSSLRA